MDNLSTHFLLKRKGDQERNSRTNRTKARGWIYLLKLLKLLIILLTYMLSLNLTGQRSWVVVLLKIFLTWVPWKSIVCLVLNRSNSNRQNLIYSNIDNALFNCMYKKWFIISNMVSFYLNHYLLWVDMFINKILKDDIYFMSWKHLLWSVFKTVLSTTDEGL